MNDNTLLFVGVAGLAVLFLLKKGSGSQDKRTALYNWQSSTDSTASNDRWRQIVLAMSPTEIDAAYTFIFDYVQRGIQVPAGSALYYQIQSISDKYQIFT